MTKSFRIALYTASTAAALVVTTLAQTTTPPAPTVDGVLFPTGYDINFQQLYRLDRPDNKQVRTIYGNSAAASVKDNAKHDYAYGSILVMETWASLKDKDTNPILDKNGRYQKDPAAVPTLFVMRKERGFGEAYGANRNGEWEYAAYRIDGTYQTEPKNSAACAICHLQAGALTDWTMRTNELYSKKGNGAVPTGIIKNYAFVPGVIRIPAGGTVTFYNDDATAHTITDDAAGMGDTGSMAPGRSISLTLTEPGEFNFHCSLHPAMRGKVIVEK